MLSALQTIVSVYEYFTATINFSKNFCARHGNGTFQNTICIHGKVIHTHTKTFNAYHVCLFDCPCASMWCAPMRMYFIKQLSVINISPRILGKTVKYFAISTYAVITSHHVIPNLAIGKIFPISITHNDLWMISTQKTGKVVISFPQSTEMQKGILHLCAKCQCFLIIKKQFQCRFNRNMVLQMIVRRAMTSVCWTILQSRMS